MGSGITVIGDWSRTLRYLHSHLQEPLSVKNVAEQTASEGVKALSSATPIRSGKTAHSWTGAVEDKDGHMEIQFDNTNVNQGANVAVLIQTGHGTGTGGYVPPTDYINPVTDRLTKKMVRQLDKIYRKDA